MFGFPPPLKPPSIVWAGRSVSAPAANRPNTIGVECVEGSDIVPFTAGQSSTPVHAIYFDDGSAWDSLNGWRDGTLSGPIVGKLLRDKAGWGDGFVPRELCRTPQIVSRATHAK